MGSPRKRRLVLLVLGIDISDTIEVKAQALQCHVTQFGPDANLLDRMKGWFARAAIEAKEKKGLEMQYAESFRRIKLHVPKDENEKAEEL